MSGQVRVEIVNDTLVAEVAGHAYGCYIISVYCADEVHYQKLPQALRHDGHLCGKCSFNPAINRAFYRSSVMVAEVVAPTNTDLMKLSSQEMVAEGHVVVHTRGKITRYLPTERYRKTLSLPEPATMVHTNSGVHRLLPKIQPLLEPHITYKEEQ